MGYTQYKMNDYTKYFLQKNKFRYSTYLSDYGDEIYTYRFPLITYKTTPTIECEISVSTMTGITNVNVYKAGTKELYPAYYNRQFGKNATIKVIDKKIEKKLNELGAYAE